MSASPRIAFPAERATSIDEPEQLKCPKRDKQCRQRGQTMTEYAMVTATIIAVLIAFYDNAGTLTQLVVNQVGGLLTAQIH